MALLDDSDPVVVLSNQIQALLHHQDGETALAAMSFTLAALIALAWTKQTIPPLPASIALREELMFLAVEMIRNRSVSQES